MDKIVVRGVSYINTLPLLYGLEREPMASRITLSLDYPSRVAQDLMEGKADLGLVPAAVIPQIEGARMVGDYGIAARGRVASVALFSQVPLEDIESVYLDYQSRTSVALAGLLMQRHWKQSWALLPAPRDYISRIQGTQAGVIIGDRALEALDRFPYHYDLAEAWTAHTGGMPFVFAAWVARRPLPEEFVEAFNRACALGMNHLPEIARQVAFPHYDLNQYFRRDIHYFLDEEMRGGLAHFLSLIRVKAYQEEK